ncbi:MAG: SDR family oxidoreductase [SAR324 cluster bacterium]|nr:SDR family oxidoreductase [SAR324 cluster bacterium]
MKMVMVTGANGFTGRAICAYLRDKGYPVRGTVREGGNPGDRTDMKSNAVVGDLLGEPDWSAALDGVDTIVHLAGMAHVLRETEGNSSAIYRQVNTLGTQRLAQAAVEAGVRRFVFTSTIVVNGISTPESPFRESDPVNPYGPYGKSKWDAEQSLLAIAAESGLETVVLRPPLMYGPGVKGNFLRLLHWVRRGAPLPLAGVKNQRSFLGIENFASLIDRCIAHPSAAGEIFLVSDGDNLSTPGLIKKLAQLMNRPARLFPMPSAVLGAMARLTGQSQAWQRLGGSLVVDAKKCRQLLEWHPPFTVNEGLREMVEWFMNRPKE